MPVSGAWTGCVPSLPGAPSISGGGSRRTAGLSPPAPPVGTVGAGPARMAAASTTVWSRSLDLQPGELAERRRAGSPAASMRAIRSSSRSRSPISPFQRCTMMAEFWPPKPNELTRATSRSALAGRERRQIERTGTLVGPVQIEGGWHHAVIERLDRRHRRHRTGCAERVPEDDLLAVMLTSGACSPTSVLMPCSSVGSPSPRARGMGADVIDVAGASRPALARARRAARTAPTPPGEGVVMWYASAVAP